VKKNRKEVSKWVRKEGLKLEMTTTRTHYILRCLKVISLGLKLEKKTHLKFRQPHHTVPRFVGGDFFRHSFFFGFIHAVIPPLLLPFNLPPCHLAHSPSDCPVLFVI
jgi:hypothetical protein